MNRMTQNLVTTQKNYVQRRSTILEPTKQPIAPREMWKNQDEEDSSDSEKIREKKKGRFRTVVRLQDDECEVFETELVDSDEPLSGESEDESKVVDDTIMTETDNNVTYDIYADKPEKKKKADYLTFESQEQAFLNRPVDHGDLRVGEDINVDEISTLKAFTIFRRLELEE